METQNNKLLLLLFFSDIMLHNRMFLESNKRLSKHLFEAQVVFRTENISSFMTFEFSAHTSYREVLSL